MDDLGYPILGTPHMDSTNLRPTMWGPPVMLDGL